MFLVDFQSPGCPTICFQVFAVILLTVSLIVAGSSFLFYRDRTAGFKITVLEIDNEEAASMRYFLKRLSMSGEEPLAMFERLTREFIILKTAPNPPYNIIISEVTPILYQICYNIVTIL